MKGLLIGALAGFLATVLLVVVLPAKWGHLKAIVSALVGFFIALGIMLVYK